MQNLIDALAAKLHELALRNRGLSRGTEDMKADATSLVTTMAAERAIIWQPIEAIAFSLKGSGQSILLWVNDEAVIGYWSDSGPKAGEWLDEEGEAIRPTHFAKIVGPNA